MSFLNCIYDLLPPHMEKNIFLHFSFYCFGCTNMTDPPEYVNFQLNAVGCVVTPDCSKDWLYHIISLYGIYKAVAILGFVVKRSDKRLL